MLLTHWLKSLFRIPNTAARRPRRQAGRWSPIDTLESRTLLTAITVTGLGDNIANDGVVTLREALEAANTNAIVNEAPAGSATETDEITFDASLAGATITLGGTELTIEDAVTITGLGADQLAVSGNGMSRVFNISSGVTAGLYSLTIKDGYSTEVEGGGGIATHRGQLTVADCVIADNTSMSYGGGIFSNYGQLTVTRSILAGNAAGVVGGGIYASGDVTITESVIRDNSGSSGGGLFLDTSTATIQSSTFSRNAAQQGGAITAELSKTQIINSTISGNEARFEGGGVVSTNLPPDPELPDAEKTLTIINSTITDNRVTDTNGNGGGGLVQFDSTVLLHNTIVAGNTAAGGHQDDIYVLGFGSVSGTHNLIGNGETSPNGASSHFLLMNGVDGNMVGTTAAPIDPILGPLADNGGPTLTHALLPGSPALNAGDNDRARDASGSPLTYDQRGERFARVVRDVVDIGAVERLNTPPVATDDTAGTVEDIPTIINVRDTDYDVDGDPLTVSIQTGPAHGTVEVNADSSVTYTPDLNFYGKDSFTYKLSDGLAESGIATVSVTVQPVNDTPVTSDDSVATNEDTPITINVLANDIDVDGDVLTVSIQAGPMHGTVEVHEDGMVTYTPNHDFSGSDSFAYLVDDGQGGTDVATVSIMVVSAEDQLANLMAEVEQLYEEGNLNNGQTNALSVKLIGALGRLERGQEHAAGNQLQAYIHQVTSLIDGGILSEQEGQFLIDLANAALDSIIS